MIEHVLVAVVREQSEERAHAMVRGALEGGIRALEITVPTPGCFSMLARLAGERSPPISGVGTVRTIEDVRRAKDAGASFIVSPHTDVVLIEAAHEAGLIAIPGALTPTEIIGAERAGGDFIKIFPVSAVGGASYVRQLRGPLPGVRLWVSGTVQLEEIEAYVAADTQLIGLTSALFADVAGDIERIVRARTEKALLALECARTSGPLLQIRGAQPLSIGLEELRRLPEADRVDLASVLPERRGQAARIRPLLEAAGVPEQAEVELRSIDGAFRRVVSAKSLYASGYLHFATDGQPLPRSAGGPLRLYIVGGDTACDNVKALSQITVVRS
jgi:2-dehydro-3-deoxyphosphogluconate aldolase/(4S)-4-hydroxy-2-oxoglutarate aldolase